MSKFWDFLKDGTLIAGIIALAVVGVWLYLLATSQQVPDTLQTVVMIILGSFFTAAGIGVGIRAASR